MVLRIGMVSVRQGSEELQTAVERFMAAPGIKRQLLNCGLFWKQDLSTALCKRSRLRNNLQQKMSMTWLCCCRCHLPYFIGTFNSNIGRLVSLYCGYNRTEEQRGHVTDKYNHFFDPTESIRMIGIRYINISHMQYTTPSSYGLACQRRTLLRRSNMRH